MYTYCIIINRHQSVGPQNNKDIILDIASNLNQIGRWALSGISQQESNIDLYLRLTRKNIAALAGRSLRGKFKGTFDRFCSAYGKLESQYADGIEDRRIWASDLKNLATTLEKGCA